MNGKKDIDPATELAEQDEEQGLPEIEHETAIDLGAGNPLAAGRATIARYAKHAPKSPGVYRMIDANGDVLYVGKAKSLRARLSSYFQDSRALHERTRAMVDNGASVDWTVVTTEVEALQLEYSWIKEFDPRFNVKYRDDKSYPWLAVTVGDEFPRVVGLVLAQELRDGRRGRSTLEAQDRAFRHRLVDGAQQDVEIDCTAEIDRVLPAELERLQLIARHAPRE